MRHVADLVTETLRVLPKIAQFFQVGVIMDPVDARNLQLADVLGDRFVRRQHELLNELVGNIIVDFLDMRRFSVLIEANFDFGKLQVQRTLREALLPEV